MSSQQRVCSSLFELLSPTCSVFEAAEHLGAGAQLRLDSTPQPSLTRFPKPAFLEGVPAGSPWSRVEIEWQSWRAHRDA